MLSLSLKIERKFISIEARARVQFLRELKRLCKKYNLEEARSTQSMLKTSNEALAWEIHELAKKHGHRKRKPPFWSYEKGVTDLAVLVMELAASLKPSR